jgi:copper homeostasis protein
MSVRLEIAVTSDTAARLALAHGADRVELCTGLEVDGVTPSRGLRDATIATGAPAHVLIRSRPGDFVYTADEVRVMAADAADAVGRGAAGVVIGALREDGTLDLDALRVLADAARSARADVEITVHRAVDAVATGADPVRSAAALAASDLRPTRILSSGGRAAAGEGADVLAEMVAVADGIQIMAGGGVVPAAIPALIGAGVSAIHLSAKGPERDHWTIDPAVVAAARAAVDAGTASA